MEVLQDAAGAQDATVLAEQSFALVLVPAKPSQIRFVEFVASAGVRVLRISLFDGQLRLCVLFFGVSIVFA